MKIHRFVVLAFILVSIASLACHQGGPGDNPPTGTNLLGAVERSSDSIITTITIVNQLNRERRVAFAACPPRNTVKLTLVSPAAAGAYRGTWDYATMDSVREMRRVFQPPGCVPFALDASLGPRARVTSRFIGFRAIDVLGDSLPDGRYSVWLFPRIVGRDPGGIPAGEIEVRRR